MRTREKLKTIEKEVCALDFAIACLEELKKGFIENANEISKDAKKTKKAEKKPAKKAEKKVVKKTKRSK
jgi:hypothetical protein